MIAQRINLLGLTREELTDFAEGIGERRYRGGQLFGWLYTKGATSFDSMTDLKKDVRERLKLSASIAGLTLAGSQESRRDATMKFLFSLSDGLPVESVLIPPSSAFTGREAAGEDEQRRLTLCVSTQVGCPLDCAFCATATMGYRRNLDSGEIVDQILQVKRLTGKQITNIVFMGMGEPLMNYDNVMRASEIIVSGLSIAARHITVSTAGWADRIRQLADERRKMKLAVSLHSAIEATRMRLMPVTKRFGVAELASALEYHYRRMKERITFEYIFFDGINDTPEEVAALVRFVRRIPGKINIIPFHSIDFTGPAGFAATLRPSHRSEDIVRHLRDQNLIVMVRSNAGDDIDAACGQLAVLEGGMPRPRKTRPAAAANGSPDIHWSSSSGAI